VQKAEKSLRYVLLVKFSNDTNVKFVLCILKVFPGQDRHKHLHKERSSTVESDKQLSQRRQVQFPEHNRSQIHDRAILLRFLGIILRALRLEVSVWIS
jgi:hypothetical protein